MLLTMTETELQRTKQMTNQNEEDDDVPFLSADTFKALQEFYTEKEAVEKSIHENWVKRQKRLKAIKRQFLAFCAKCVNLDFP